MGDRRRPGQGSVNCASELPPSLHRRGAAVRSTDWFGLQRVHRSKISGVLARKRRDGRPGRSALNSKPQMTRMARIKTRLAHPCPPRNPRSKSPHRQLLPSRRTELLGQSRQQKTNWVFSRHRVGP